MKYLQLLVLAQLTTGCSPACIVVPAPAPAYPSLPTETYHCAGRGVIARITAAAKPISVELQGTDNRFELAQCYLLPSP